MAVGSSSPVSWPLVELLDSDAGAAAVGLAGPVVVALVEPLSSLRTASTTPATAPAAPPTAAAAIPVTPPVRSARSFALPITRCAADFARAGALRTIEPALLAALRTRVAIALPPARLVAPPALDRLEDEDFALVDFLLADDDGDFNLPDALTAPLLRVLPLPPLRVAAVARFARDVFALPPRAEDEADDFMRPPALLPPAPPPLRLPDFFVVPLLVLPARFFVPAACAMKPPEGDVVIAE